MRNPDFRKRLRARGASAPLVLFSLVLFGLACHRGLSVEEQRLVAVVKEYNLLICRAYLGRQADLVTCATPNEKERLSLLIAGLDQKGLVMEARQESFELGAIKIFKPPTLADVETTEVWGYRHADPAGKAAPESPKRLRYGLRYKLVQNQARWFVDRIELLRSEELPVGP
jgi:hypothetical protein